MRPKQWKRGRAGTATHDCKRHGTTTLFALNTLDERISSMCQPPGTDTTSPCAQP